MDECPRVVVNVVNDTMTCFTWTYFQRRLVVNGFIFARLSVPLLYPGYRP